MTELLNAIYTKYDGDANLKAELVGGLWLNEAPQETVMPYGIYQLISSVAEYDTNATKTIEDCLVQFSLFDDEQVKTNIYNAYADLVALYDECTLTVTGYGFIRMWRLGQRLIKDEDHNWQFIIEYKILIQEN